MGRFIFRMAMCGGSWIILNLFILFPPTIPAADSIQNEVLTGENEVGSGESGEMNGAFLGTSTFQLCYDVKNFQKIPDSDGSLMEALISSVSTALNTIEAIDKKLVEDHQALWNKIRDLESGQGGASGSVDTILRPRDCAEIQLKADDPARLDSSIAHTIFPFGPQGKGIRVGCDFQTDGGRWTILQRRRSGPKEEFFRGWAEYEEGFGSVTSNYWIGLKVIHILTSTSLQSLRVELGDWDGSTASANYGNFSVGNSNESYTLRIGGYWGDAGDSMDHHNGKKFYTKDKDDAFNCAESRHGAWWFNYCAYSSLNGYYYPNSSTQSPSNGDGEGLYWYHWKNQWSYSLKSSEMKIRGLGAF